MSVIIQIKSFIKISFKLLIVLALDLVLFLSMRDISISVVCKIFLVV
jgi:hypothetical protein